MLSIGTFYNHLGSLDLQGDSNRNSQQIVYGEMTWLTHL